MCGVGASNVFQLHMDLYAEAIQGVNTCIFRVLVPWSSSRHPKKVLLSHSVSNVKVILELKLFKCGVSFLTWYLVTYKGPVITAIFYTFSLKPFHSGKIYGRVVCEKYKIMEAEILRGRFLGVFHRTHIQPIRSLCFEATFPTNETLKS